MSRRERKRGVKKDSQVVSLDDWVNGDVLTDTRRRRVGLKG